MTLLSITLFAFKNKKRSRPELRGGTLTRAWLIGQERWFAYFTVLSAKLPFTLRYLSLQAPPSSPSSLGLERFVLVGH